TAKKHSRPAELGRLEISITPPGFDVPDRTTIDAYAAAGVDRLVLRPRPEMNAAALERFAAETGGALRLPAAWRSHEDRESPSASLRRRWAAVAVRGHGDR